VAKTFDALTRSLLENHPADWLTLLGLIHGEPARVVNSDLSTVIAEADKVIRVEGPEPWLVHIELQTSFDRTLPRRLLRYNALLNLRHDLPIHSVAVLLRSEADGPGLDGLLQKRSPDGRCSLEFRYHVVRVWELPTQELLSSGPGVLSLAPITVAAPEDVPAIIEELKQRVDPAGASPEAREFWAATALMTGLRFPWDLIKDSFRGITAMRESSAYVQFVKEGSIIEARKVILRLGQTRFGPPDEATRQKLAAMSELEQLELLIDNVYTSSDWDDLLEKHEQFVVEGYDMGRTEGQILEARRLVLRMGEKRFGPPNEQTRARIAAITDLERLEFLFEKFFTASDWENLLGEP
jgi:hypothetical protein